MTIKGAMVAATVAGLFAAAAPAVVHAKGGGKVSCTGVNECKGKGGCKSATNDCKGKNECKGKGSMKMSEKDCTAKGGTVAAPAEKK
ncbi:MAG: hypothetical protein JWN44_6970 [Myxococcales bacterium]|nr:hypothetical protein [Myxococcales bacterium]